MKKIKTKNLTKQIMCIIIVLMLCNFIIPNITYAAADGDSGTIFAPICKFVTYLCDSIMQFLQNKFTSMESIDQGDGTYNFQYSPAIIFSGKVPAFDINFIKPNTEVESSNNYGKYVKDNIEKFYEKRSQDFKDKYLNAKNRDERYVVKGKVKKQHARDNYTAYYWVENDILYVACEFDAGWGIYIFGSRYNYYYHTCSINDPEIQETLEKEIYSSTANELQPTIATWYNSLKRIALVGLLSALVYIGIQILLTSVSGKENSKYKKMLVDWLIALCLLFTLQYIMSVTLVITEKISSIFNDGETDHLLTTLRNEIAQSETWEEIVSQVIMYVVMTIYTVMFTFMYLKRVVYMGFFTMIAPLITLTYPLDKIKDSKAQAFTMWIREYVFNALIQVVHLIVYYTLVGSALGLVDVYPLYGVLAIGFMTQGEKIIRKMFGFNNATTVGTMEAVATGGLVAAALNKLQKVSKPNKKTDNSKEGSNKNVRTVSNSIANSLRGNGTNSRTNLKTGPNMIGGATSLIGKYGWSGVKAIGKGALRTASTAVGTMAGAAGAIASGGDVFKGALAGGTMGDGLAQGAMNFGSNLGTKMQNLGNDIQDTYNEGAYGKEYAQDVKRVREFKQTREYKELKNEFGDKLSDEKLSELLKAAMEKQ